MAMAEIEPGEYVDVYVNIPAVRSGMPDESDGPEHAGRGSSSPRPTSWLVSRPEQWVAKMTDAGIERALLNCQPDRRVRAADHPDDEPGHARGVRGPKCEEVAKICQQYPGRLFGACAIDPNRRMDAVRMVEMAVKEYDFRAIRTGNLDYQQPSERCPELPGSTPSVSSSASRS